MNNQNNIGSSNRLMYDNCETDKRLTERTAPIGYYMYDGAYENVNKCKFDKFWRPFDLVDQESELKNITRLNSRCPQFKYNPKCKASATCLSTFDKSVPVIFAPELCPILENNIPKASSPGYDIPKQSIF